MITTRRNSQGKASATRLILRQLEAARGALIQASDIRGTSPSAAGRALSRLAQQGVIERVRKGLYYIPRETLLGRSRPSERAVLQKVLGSQARPTGITAANMLGLSTQVAARPEFAVYASALPREAGAARAQLRRRPRNTALDPADAALLEVLRDRGRHSESGPTATCDRIRTLLTPGPSKRPARLRRLRDAALEEPPRVRAMLGALMESVGLPESLWRPLRESLNPQSRFDFGLFSELPNAAGWQAR